MSQEFTSIVGDLLARCDFALSSTPIDPGFLQLCLEDAASRSCPMEASPGIPSFRPWNISGATIAYISYGHLESLPVKLYIALYTSLAVYIEDVYTDQPDVVNTFNHNFVTRQPQQTAVLRALDKLLGETSKYFDAVQANLITSSTLNFMTSIAIEHAVNKLNITAGADKFPQFLRGLSGISCAYCLFIFPKDVHLNTYIQAMPSMMDYINHMNDVLSFYKEEVNGEDNNYISILSKHRGVPKTETLEQLANLVASSYEAASNILRASGAAHTAWARFAQGHPEASMSQEIARIVNNLMTRCGLPLSNTPIDEEFLQLCLENAAARGCPMEAAPGIPAFRPFISIGATMAYTSYGHLESLPATLYIALHATLVTYIEDVYSDQPDLVNAFNHSFVMRLPQQTAVLQKLDDLLAETSKHFDAIQANLILTSTMNFMTSIAIEHGVNKLNLRPEADGFPQFLRGLSGISCAYCMFIFPKDVHIDSYIQAIPSMMDFINHMKLALVNIDLLRF
ncbi:terpene cyclase [Pleurotus pulmonarius]|nr:terpene cyclase [Pleurotus pulmonarius]KAF4601766.1 terpene cyclase [Pleurotus pulmonarius]